MASDEKNLMTDQRNDHVRRLARLLLYSRLFPTLATIKAKGFEEEREWRLFSSGQEGFPVDVRAGRRGLLPYKQIAVNVPWELSREDRLSHPTIVELVVGPGPDQAEQVVLLGKC